jgi:RNA polymerase sigma factor (sigma-70 family)
MCVQCENLLEAGETKKKEVKAAPKKKKKPQQKMVMKKMKRSKKERNYEDNARLLQEYHEWYPWSGKMEELKIQLDREPTPAEWLEHSGGQTMEEYQRLFKQGEAARAAIIELNMPLVFSVANNFARRWNKDAHDRADLIQAGLLGLNRAIEKFDAKVGARFSTYASWWVKSAVRRQINSCTYQLHIPESRIAAGSKYEKTRAKMQEELGREVTDDEVNKKLGMSAKDVWIAQRVGQIKKQAMSLNGAAYKQDGGRETQLAEILTSQKQDIDFQMVRTLNTILDRVLSPQEATIVRLKYGLTTKDGTHVNKMTSAKIAEQSGFSKQRISQIYRGALQKLAESQELQEIAVDEFGFATLDMDAMMDEMEAEEARQEAEHASDVEAEMEEDSPKQSKSVWISQNSFNNMGLY